MTPIAKKRGRKWTCGGNFISAHEEASDLEKGITETLPSIYDLKGVHPTLPFNIIEAGRKVTETFEWETSEDGIERDKTQSTVLSSPPAWLVEMTETDAPP
jgi:hypothetical protein